MINNFISTYITHRPIPLTSSDFLTKQRHLEDSIAGKSVLVIGGAGSIGSQFIYQLLPFKPKALTVVDTNENGLAELARSIRSDSKLSSCVPGGEGGEEGFLLYPMDFASSTFEKMFKASRHSRHRSGDGGRDGSGGKDGSSGDSGGRDGSSGSGSGSKGSCAGVVGGFDIVANFSAHKHVRSEKDIFPIEALIRNNHSENKNNQRILFSMKTWGGFNNVV